MLFEMPYVWRLTDDVVHDHHVPSKACNLLKRTALAIAAIPASQEVLWLGCRLSSSLFLGKILLVRCRSEVGCSPASGLVGTKSGRTSRIRKLGG